MFFKVLLTFVVFVICSYVIHVCLLYRKNKKEEKQKLLIQKMVDDMDVNGICEVSKIYFKKKDMDDKKLAILSKATNRNCNFLDPCVAKYGSFIRYTHKERINEKECSINRVEFKFHYCTHPLIGDFLSISVEAHDGEPQWVNKEMLYNYPISHYKYFVRFNYNEIKDIVDSIINKYYIIDPKDYSRSNECSYYTYKKYGHLMFKNN